MGICCMYGCLNRTDRKRKPGVSFHRFPKDISLKKQWIKAVRRLNWTAGPNSFVCSEHFSKECINRTFASGRTELRENAVPTTLPNYSPHLQSKNKKVVFVPPRDATTKLPGDSIMKSNDIILNTPKIDNIDGNNQQSEINDFTLKIENEVSDANTFCKEKSMCSIKDNSVVIRQEIEDPLDLKTEDNDLLSEFKSEPESENFLLVDINIEKSDTENVSLGLGKQVEKVYTNELNIFQCAHCELHTKHESTLKRHMLVTHTEAKDSFKCTLCDFSTRYRNSFKSHLLAKHTEANEKKYM